MQESDADFSKPAQRATFQPPPCPLTANPSHGSFLTTGKRNLQTMKKPLAIVCLLLLLAALIGVERFNRSSRGVSFDEKTNGVRADKPQETRKSRTRSDKTATPPITPIESATSDDTAPMDKVGRIASKPAFIAGNASSGRAIKTLHYIRIQTILADDKPTEETLARLLKAVKQVATANHADMVLDIDGLTTSQVPVLVSASPRFDLTNEVAAVYRDLARGNPVSEIRKAGSYDSTAPQK
jgi:hypothetical protein